MALSRRFMNMHALCVYKVGDFLAREIIHCAVGFRRLKTSLGVKRGLFGVYLGFIIWFMRVSEGLDLGLGFVRVVVMLKCVIMFYLLIYLPRGFFFYPPS